MSDYGWLITEGSPDIGLDVETGTKGPRDILDSLEALLDNGSGEQFRMYDDDGEWSAPAYSSLYIAVPEPVTLSLLTLGGLVLFRRRTA